MEKGKAYQGAAIRMLKALLSAYIITGFLLLAAALLWFFYAGRLKGLFPPDTP